MRKQYKDDSKTVTFLKVTPTWIIATGYWK